MVKEYGNEKEQQLLKELRDKGHTVYSISRINNFNTCAYGYYLTYVKRQRGLGSAWTEMGSLAHDTIEKHYRNEVPEGFNFKQEIHNKAAILDLMDMGFPNDVIKNAFMADMCLFADNFEKMNGDFTLEKMFITQFGDVYLHGYIDAIQEINEYRETELPNGTVPYYETLETNVLDWKTSTKFKAKELLEHGRQLVIYKIGLEKTSGMKIDKVAWNMLKYVYVCHVQKNKKVKKRMINRSKVAKEMEKAFRKDMAAENMNEFAIDIAIDKLKETNDISVMPKIITDKYWVEDCILEYEVTPEIEAEAEKYIVNTVKSIEALDEDDESAWKPADVEAEHFYCNTLCSHRATCPFLKEYNRKNPYKKSF